MYNKIGICFASEDRSNFLEGLIKRLRNNPRAIISELEIRPALHPNSSVRVNYSDFYAMIMIISKHNKDTNWARGALKFVRKQVSADPHRVIPVIIDNCFLPEDPPGEQAINLFDHDDYSFELFNIRSLAGLHLSEHLNYNHSIYLLFPNMSEFTNKLFLLICNEALAADYPLISIPALSEKYNFRNSAKLSNALNDLQSAGYIEQNMRMIRISGSGLDKYLYIFYQNYANIRKSVIEFLLGNNSADRKYTLRSEIISKTIRQPKLVVNTILEELMLKGKVRMERTIGENWAITQLQHNMFENILTNYGLQHSFHKTDRPIF